MAQSWVRTATLVVMCGAAALPGMAADSLTTPPRQTELLALVAGNSQQTSAPDAQTGTITGTVTDVNGDAVPGATIVLEGPSVSDHPTVVTNENGFFQLKNLNPGIPYHIAVTANGFADWTSPNIILQPGQVLDLPGVSLQIATLVTTVSAISSEQLAVEQIRVEEKQRVLGVIPNFYVVYDHHAVPLTSKLKFELALRSSVDPVTFFGVGVLAGIDQATDTPKFVQGAKGYGERLGATYADGFTDILIGGAVLPSLLHQDPRYFYQGTGTKKSRVLHALSSPFICKGDNGRWQPNYSSVGGDLASGAIANAYYPASNRGVRLVFGNALITTGGRMVNGLVQEFFLRRFTHDIKSN
jgi:outer membrane receptor protein involved in Fe transport